MPSFVATGGEKLALIPQKGIFFFSYRHKLQPVQQKRCDTSQIKLGARLQEARLEFHSEKRRQLFGDESINVELRVSL